MCDLIWYRISLCGIFGMALATAEETNWVDQLNLETHGFASFGYLDTSHNNWLGQTRDGTAEFWEVGANVIARPMDRLRIGAQVFARDLVKYDNGNPTLDWAYADYRLMDAIGIQAGRFKLPLGLYNESLDIDAARTSIFLAPSVYALRSRDLYISTDGAKIYGLCDLNSAGSFEYAAFVGAKEFSTKDGFATYISELGVGDKIHEMRINYVAGGMCHWHTPIAGLGFRVSGVYADDFYVDAYDTVNVQDTETHADYWSGYVSLIYEMPSITLVTEYLRLRGRGETLYSPGIPGFGNRIEIRDNTEGAYISATWHVKPWLEFYGALEGAWVDANDRDGTRAYSWIVAANVMPLQHWSLKLEYRDTYGTMGIYPSDNTGGIAYHWQVLALKTTVDF